MNTFDLPTNAGLEGFDNTDMVIARRALFQNTSTQPQGREVAPGQFVEGEDKVAIGKTMNIVVLKVVKNRVLFHEQSSGKKGVMCRSANSKTPDHVDHKDYFKQAENCEDCQYATQDLQYDLLCYDVKASKETGAPVVFWYTARKTQRQPVQILVSAIQQRRKPLQSFTVTMSSKRAEGKNGNYYTIGFSDIMPITDSDLQNDVVDAYNIFASGVVGGSSDDEMENVAPPF